MSNTECSVKFMHAIIRIRYSPDYWNWRKMFFLQYRFFLSIDFYVLWKNLWDAFIYSAKREQVPIIWLRYVLYSWKMALFLGLFITALFASLCIPVKHKIIHTPIPLLPNISSDLFASRHIGRNHHTHHWAIQSPNTQSWSQLIPDLITIN